MSGVWWDLVVVGGGTAGAFAATTAAQNGMDVVLLERKSAAEAGQIACGDAIKGTSTFPDVLDREYLRQESFTNENVQRARFLNPKGDDLEIPFGDESGAVIDRKRYGEVLLEETERAGAAIHYDTVVNDVVQADDGRVTGVQAVRDGDPVTYEARVVIDAAGALSVLQDRIDFSGTTFDTNVHYSQFCSAYREIVETEEPVDYDDAIVFTPTEELGYLWYFPRSPTEINVGLGFQMNKPPIELVDVLTQSMQTRPEFQNATVVDKRGAALPTRRPYDSAVAPGYLAAGDAAGHVNPTTGGGIPGAARAGHWAGEIATEAISDGDVSEAALWEYNERVQHGFGQRFAAMDLYNVFGSAHEIDELTDVIAALPGEMLIELMGKRGTTSLTFWEKVQTTITTAIRTRGHWSLLHDAYQVNNLAARMKEVYDDYPSAPTAFDDWRATRDRLMEDVYDVSGAEPKY